MYPVSSKLVSSLQSTRIIGKLPLALIPLRASNSLSQRILEEVILTRWRNCSMQTRESFSLSRNTDKRRDSSAITDYIIILLIIKSSRFISLRWFFFVLVDEDLFLLFNIKHYISLHRFFRYLCIFKASLIFRDSNKVQYFRSQVRRIRLEQN